MTQQLVRPAADIATGLWTPTPLWEQIDALTSPGPGVVTSGANPVSDTLEVKLSRVLPPKAGDQTLTVELQQVGTGNVPVLVGLVQGTRIIASQVVTPGGTFQDVVITLSQAEKDQITDYADLRARVVAGYRTVSGTTCGHCTVLPYQWQVTIAGLSSPGTPHACTNCEGLNHSWTLTWQPNPKYNSNINNLGDPDCLWDTGDAPGACDNTTYPPGLPSMWLIHSLQSDWVLKVVNSAQYGPVLDASWNCLGKNVIGLNGGTGECLGWPASVTVYPM